ncbi:MAG: universal stress protein [Nitrosopumilus sp.]|nr:universal stress protein [Nitrosopumilus sp.]MDH3486466.1 universal stress protein [Nitrosopumilus sp.]
MSKIFKNIAVAIITPTHTKKSFGVGLELAKKFESDFTVIECMYKIQPKLYFFETKSDKKKAQLQISKLKKELENWKKIALKEGIHIKTKFVLTDSIAHWVIDYVKENKIDLLIVDYPKLSMVEMTLYDDIINTIHHESHCHLLTTKQ